MEKLKESISVAYFTWKRELPLGRSIWVSGSDPLLGAWDLSKAVKLNWSEGNNWTSAVPLPPGKYEYKYVEATSTAQKDKTAAAPKWEEGPNRCLCIGDAPDSLIKVMSFNIRYANTHDGVNGWENRKTHVIKRIMDSGCDFVGLQEDTLGQQQYIQKELASKYDCVYQPRDGAAGEGSPIYYLKARWWLEDKGIFWYSDTPDVVASRSFGNGIPRIAMWAKLRSVDNNMPVLVVNTHYDHIDSSIRQKSSAVLAQRLKIISRSFHNVVLMGDFNAEPDTPEISAIGKETGLVDISTGKEKYATFHNWLGEPYGEKIDYIFVSPVMSCEKFDIDRAPIDEKKKLYPSDHFPILASLHAK